MPSENDIVNVDRLSFRSQSAAVAAVPGTIEFQNINNVMKSVNDQAVASGIGGSIPDAAAASIYGAAAAGVHSDLTGRQALSVIMNGTSARVDVAGSAAENVDFAGLAGDADGDYELEFYLVGAGTGTVKVQPNQISANQNTEGFYTNGAGVVTPTHGGGQLVINAMSAGVIMYGRATLRSKSGQGFRYYKVEMFGSDGYMYQYTGLWSDTATVIINMRIAASAPGVIGVGSWFVLRKLGKL